MTDQPTQLQPGQPPGGADMLEWAVGHYLAAKIQSQHILNQNGANLVYNHGRDIAKKLGLDEKAITPFPSPSNTQINVEKPEPEKPPEQPSTTSRMVDLLKSAGLAATIATGGAGAAVLYQHLNAEPTPVVQPAEPAKQPAQASEVGFTVR